jgi:hypothetical protein
VHERSGARRRFVVLHGGNSQTVCGFFEHLGRARGHADAPDR